ncbi:MAG: hypothetical protein ACRD0U_13535, partial [Acidimicrobiales bacterium]
ARGVPLPARHVVTALVLVPAVLLAACSGDGDGAGPAPDEVAGQAIDATVAAGTAHFASTLDSDSGPGVTLLLRFDGDVSFATNAARYDVYNFQTSNPLHPTAFVQSVLTGGRAWQRAGAADSPWEEVAVNFTAIAPWTNATATTPAASLRDALLGRSFRTVGDDDIDGEPVSRYQSTAQRTIDLWTDRQGRIRLIRSDAPHPDATQAAAGQREQCVVELTEFGKDVEITPPAALASPEPAPQHRPVGLVVALVLAP